MRRLFCLLVLFTALGSTLAADIPKRSWDETLIERLPQAYREITRQQVTTFESWYPRLLDANDQDLFEAALNDLNDTPEGIAFLMNAAKTDESAARRQQIVEALRPYARTHADGKALFDELAASDPSAEVAVAAMDAMVQNESFRLRPVVKKRLLEAKEKGDVASADLLWLRDTDFTFGKVSLPDFAYRAPAVFAVAPKNKKVRVLAFGDFGTGEEGQFKTAAAMREYDRKVPFTFGITMGDNFYPRGLNDPDSPRWKTEWEDIYGPLGITFYASLGNHDYGWPDSPAAEIAYGKKSKTWRMPAPFYTYTAGSAQFFAIDTVRMSRGQLDWLEKALKESKARWKIVYGHYQMYSATRRDNDIDQADLIGRLLPVLKSGKADVYLCGHDHNLQELQPEDGVHFFVMGAGGQGGYTMTEKEYPRSIFRSGSHGFGVVEIDGDKASISIVGLDGKALHKRELRK